MLSPKLLVELREHRSHLQSSLGLVAEEAVTFRWLDSAHHNEQQLMTLSLDEFPRRFPLHILPKGFVRIRNFGFPANRRRATLLALCFDLLG
jgi:Putative transposase